MIGRAFVAGAVVGAWYVVLLWRAWWRLSDGLSREAERITRAAAAG